MESQDFVASRTYGDSGPLSVSELQHSVPNSNSGKRKKDFKRQKVHREATESFTTANLSQHEPTTQSTIEEPILNRLRSRLDPTYNTTNAPSHEGATVVDSDSLPKSSTPAVDKPVQTVKKKRRKKSRDADTNDQSNGPDFTTSEAQLTHSTTQVPTRVIGS